MEVGLTTAEITGVVSVIVALCAVVFTAWHACITRTHNKLSVKPHLTTWTHSAISTRKYSVDLLNKGIGPAFIKSVGIYVDGKLMEGDGCKPIEDAVALLFPPSIYRYDVEQAFVGVGYSMAANEKCRLAAIEFSEESPPSAKTFEDALKRVDVIIHYASIYEENFTLDSKKLRPS